MKCHFPWNGLLNALLLCLICGTALAQTDTNEATAFGNALIADPTVDVAPLLDQWVAQTIGQ